MASASTTGILSKLHGPVRPPLPHRHPGDTHMGSRVLLSQDLSASKFSMIILETIHRGPEAGHTPALAQVAAAAAAPSSARRPRGPRWEVPVAGSREPSRGRRAARRGRRRPRAHRVPGASPRRTRAQAEAATVCRALPPAPLPGESSRRSAGRAQTRVFLSALGLGACWQRGRAEVKKAKTKGSSMGTVRGSSRLPAPPRRWLPINLATIN